MSKIVFSDWEIELAQQALSLDVSILPKVRYMHREQLPETGAVYFAARHGVILYIGQSANLRQRWARHGFNLRYSTHHIVIFYLEESDRSSRERLESLLIVIHQPRLNGQGVSAKPDGMTSLRIKALIQVTRDGKTSGCLYCGRSYE